jgi:hypothetical protein
VRTSDGDEPVNVLGVDVAHVAQPTQVEHPHLTTTKHDATNNVEGIEFS